MGNYKVKSVEVFIDGTDWRYEIGEAAGGNTIYPTLEDARENLPCNKSCGIAKVKVEFLEWAQ
jgi:hypothetical protein